MNAAVITLTRDRLDYTMTCFQTLEQHAGIEYDHYVLDNASTDGTINWLSEWTRSGKGQHIIFSKENLGICVGANRLLELLDPSRYDVIVRFDNDCEVTQPDTLKVCAELSAKHGAIVSPRVNGLNNPPPTIRTVSLSGHPLDETAILGGIFMVIPAFLFDELGYRFNERAPLATGDEEIVPWWRMHGGVCGYLQEFSVNHYETTEGQKARYPEYEQRKVAEIAAG